VERRKRALEDVVMIDSFWSGKRVLLTGHTGFKGAWLALYLEALGAKLTGLALAPDKSPSLFGLAGLESHMDSVIGDIRDLQTVDAVVERSQPDITVHMAAQALVRRGYKEPVATYATNVLGTVHVLDAVRRLSNARACLVVTSDKCYENREWLWPYRENEPMGGRDPYSNSKGCAELVARAYRESYYREKGIALASARAGNVIGGGDWSEDRLVPDLVRGFAAREPTMIRQPKAIRPWQHVLDAIHGYMMLIERLWHAPADFAEEWNFGPTESGAVAVEVIADRVVAQWGDGATWAHDPESGVHEAHLLKLDSTKARTLLGWRPKLDVEHSVDWTVNWYRAHASGINMRDFTRKQIDEFQAR
jgi:CDP-glucose 4,6-dehydratase